MADRLVMPCFMAEPARWIGHFDLLALSWLSDQAPIAVIEAMAAGLPVGSPAVGRAAAMVPAANRPVVRPAEPGLRAAQAPMGGNSYLRPTIRARHPGPAHHQVPQPPPG